MSRHNRRHRHHLRPIRGGDGMDSFIATPSVDRFAFVVIAILSPLIVIISVFSVLIQAAMGKLEMGPCPEGLEEAERIV